MRRLVVLLLLIHMLVLHVLLHHRTIVICVLKVVILIGRTYVAFRGCFEFFVDAEGADKLSCAKSEHAKEDSLRQRVVEDHLLHGSPITGIHEGHKQFHGRAEAHDHHAARMHACIGHVGDPHVHDLGSTVHRSINERLSNNRTNLAVRQCLEN